MAQEMQAPVGKTTAFLPSVHLRDPWLLSSHQRLFYTPGWKELLPLPRAATRCRCCRVVPAQGSSAAQGSGHGRAGRLETEGPRPSSRGHRGRNQDSDAPRLQTPDGPAACVLAGPSTTFQRAECNVHNEVAASLRPAGHRRSLRRSQQRRFCRRGAGWGQARDGGAGGGWACAAGTPPPALPEHAGENRAS